LPKKKISKKAMSAGTILHTVFWDDTGVIHVNFLLMRTTLNFGHCTATLRSLDACLRQVCPQRKMSKVLLLHDIRTHKSVHTTLTVIKFRPRVSQLPLRVIDSHYLIFGCLKGSL